MVRQPQAPVLWSLTRVTDQFVANLEKVFIELAQLIIRDGEGAVKFVSVVVDSAADSQRQPASPTLLPSRHWSKPTGRSDATGAEFLPLWVAPDEGWM